MNAAFLIERLSHYQWLGPIIDEALRQGWEVEVWHDYNQPRAGLKGYLFPDLESVPTFQHGRPVYKRYHSAAELAGWIKQHTVDVILSLVSPARYVASPSATPGPRWVSVQSGVDFFLRNKPEWLFSCDAAVLYNNWWVSWGAAYLQEQRVPDAGDGFSRQLAAKAVPTGFPELDQCRLIDPTEVRRRWKIPPSQPVVVLSPFPTSGSLTFWSRKIYLEPNPLRQALHVLAHRRFHYWPQVRHGWHDAAVARAIRAFCDRNGAYLLVKSRAKIPIPLYLEAVADQCLYDESYYPATVLEALSIANLCISFYSTIVMEAIALGVPHLCVTFSGEDYTDGNPQASADFKLFYHTQEGGFFRFRGASTPMAIPEVITTLPEKRLADFALDPEARAVYVRKFLGDDDGQSSGRVVEVMQRLAQGTAASMAAAR